MEALFGKTYQLLSNMLDYRSSRHQVITSNVTNLDTPGFKPKDLKFPEELKKEMNSAPASLVRTDPRHIASQKNSTGKKYEVVETGEKVNIDTEMMNVSENNLMYNLTVELLARKFSGLDTVLKETK